VKLRPIFQTWGRVLTGRVPTLSIEITRECPLRCPGCYAYDPAHLGGGVNLRELSDFRGDELIGRVLALVEREKPLHISIVGGEPLVRYRELDVLLPKLVANGTHVQVVTSAVRPIPLSWAKIPRLNLVVSIDGLQPEHDVRRNPATYDRIKKHIVGHQMIVHCTITAQMLGQEDYLERFVREWSASESVQRIWMSIFTPQLGEHPVEALTSPQRESVVRELLRLRLVYPKLDMSEGMLKAFLAPPKSPEECIFAKTTLSVSADLKTKIVPCQLGGNPDCARCGCIASMGLSAIGDVKVVGPVTAGGLFHASAAIGKRWTKTPPAAADSGLVSIAKRQAS